MTYSVDYEVSGRVPEYIRAARTQPCPYCGAETGDPCRTVSGRASYTHGGRQRITSNAYRIGIEEGLRTALILLDWQARKSGVNVTVEQVKGIILSDFTMLAESNRKRVTPPGGGES